VAEIYLGTSSFTAAGWRGTFYPQRIKPAECLSFYARHFETVEVDSTFYACPSPRTVEGWALKTPSDFVFSVKVPQIVTHEKVLADCNGELKQFVDTMSILGKKLGPMVLQFPFFDRGMFRTQSDFLDRLIPFLKALPPNYKFAVEIRNRDWLDAQFAGVLRDFGVALVLQDQSLRLKPTDLSFNPTTTDWTYIRWLGDRNGIERVTKTWDKIVVDRAEQLSWWVDYCYQTTKRGVSIYAYANNHYAGHAPTTIRQFRELWNTKALPVLWQPVREEQEPTLF
jgi:uncharacterized protein YecE (DUF72 family)